MPAVKACASKDNDTKSESDLVDPPMDEETRAAERQIKKWLAKPHNMRQIIAMPREEQDQLMEFIARAALNEL